MWFRFASFVALRHVQIGRALKVLYSVTTCHDAGYPKQLKAFLNVYGDIWGMYGVCMGLSHPKHF